MLDTRSTVFDTNNIRFDVNTGKFIQVTPDHPVFENQASRTFVEAHPERFLTAEQVASYYEKAKPNLQRFPMRDGPSLPRWLGEVLYAGYAVAYPNGISFEKLISCGGLTWTFVETIYKDRAGWTALNGAIREAQLAGKVPRGHFFEMQNGPNIPWELAEVIYAGYSARHGKNQSLMRLHERGGFAWEEVSDLYKNPECKAAMDAELKRQGFA